MASYSSRCSHSCYLHLSIERGSFLCQVRHVLQPAKNAVPTTTLQLPLPPPPSTFVSSKLISHLYIIYDITLLENLRAFSSLTMAYRTAKKVVTFDDVDPTIIRQRRNTRSQSPSKKTLQNQSSTASRPSNSPSPSKAPSQTGSGMTSKSTSSLSTGQSSAKSRSDNVSRSTRSQSPTKAFHNAVSETFKRKAKTPSPTKSGLSKKPRTTANMDIRRPEIIPWDFTSQSKASTGVSSHSNLASDGAASSNIIYSPAVEPSDEGDRYGSRSPESENSQNQLDQDTPDFDAEDQDDIDQDIHDLDDDNQDQDGDSNQEVDSFRQQRSPNVSAYSKEKSSNLHQGPQADTNKGDPRDKSPREHHQQAKHVRQSLADFKKALEQVAKPPGIHFVRSSTPRGTDNLRHRRSQSKDGKITQLQIASLEKTMEALDDLDNHFGERLKSLEEAESITVIAESGKSATEPQTARADPSQPERTLGEEYIPVRFAYPQHPQGEQSDDWWVRSVRELFDKVMSCAEKHYGQVDIKVDINKEDGSYWANAQATPELENYVSMVAEADPRNGGWDRLITEKSQRAYLITGIIAKVLEAKVFDPLLFGAEKSQVEFLEELEKKFIDNEGKSHFFNSKIILACF